MKKRNNPKIEAMKQRSLILESERKNLHTPKFYLTEQEEEIKRPAGDPYEYKKDETGYYFKKRDEENWKKTNNSSVKAVFGDLSSSKQTITSKKLTNVSSDKPKNIKGFQQWVINTKGDKSILGKGGDSGYGDDGKWGDKTAAAWGKYGSEYQNKGDAEIIKKIESKSKFDKGPFDFIRDRFPNIVQFFDAKPLTDKDFTTDDKKVIYDAIQSSIKRVGNVKIASTTYGDYGQDVASKFDNQKGSPSDWDVVWGAITNDDRFAMATLLGKFTWEKINDKTFKVTDTYDFKHPGYKAISGVNRKSLEGKSILELKKEYGLSYYEAARVAAWVEHPDNIPSKALPIELTINVDDFA